MLLFTSAVEAADPPRKESFSVAPKGELQNWVMSQTNPFFGETSRTWVETSGRFGLVLEYDVVTIETGLIGVRTSGEDPYGTRASPPDFELDQAYIRFASLPGLPIDVAIGRQNLTIGTQFLFGDGVYDGFVSSTRQGAYHTPRKAFDAVRIRSSVAGFAIDAFAYHVDPSWHGTFGDDGVLGGAEVSRKLESIGGTYAMGAFHRASIDDEDNDMTIFDFRGEQPIPEAWTSLAGVYVSGEVVAETGTCRNPFYCNDIGGHMTEHAWHAETGIRADTVWLRPFAEAGYVYFSPDFTPIAYAASDWGRWYLGNQIPWLVFNTNAHVVRTDVGFWPHETVQLRAQYFNTREVKPSGTSDGGTLSDEWSFIASWFPNEWLWVTVMLGYADPGDALAGTGFVNPFVVAGPKAVAVGDKSSFDFTTAVGLKF